MLYTHLYFEILLWYRTRLHYRYNTYYSHIYIRRHYCRLRASHLAVTSLAVAGVCSLHETTWIHDICGPPRAFPIFPRQSFIFMSRTCLYNVLLGTKISNTNILIRFCAHTVCVVTKCLRILLYNRYNRSHSFTAHYFSKTHFDKAAIKFIDFGIVLI